MNKLKFYPVKIQLMTLFMLVIFSLNFANGQPIPREDYDLYSRFLDSFLDEVKFNGSSVLLEKETLDRPTLNGQFIEDAKWSPEVKKLFHKFVSICRVRQKFEKRFKLKKYKVDVEPKGSIDSLFIDHINAGWAQFIARYPYMAAIISLSRLVLSDDGKMGMIYIGITWKENYGFGSLIYFDVKRKRLKLIQNRIWSS